MFVDPRRPQDERSARSRATKSSSRKVIRSLKGFARVAALPVPEGGYRGKMAHLS
jgi:hypothetical protein